MGGRTEQDFRSICLPLCPRFARNRAERRTNIGQAKIVPDIEQRGRMLLGQRIGEAVAKVQSAASTEPLAVIDPRLHRRARQTIIDWGDVDAEVGQESVLQPDASPSSNRIAIMADESTTIMEGSRVLRACLRQLDPIPAS